MKRYMLFIIFCCLTFGYFGTVKADIQDSVKISKKRLNTDDLNIDHYYSKTYLDLTQISDILAQQEEAIKIAKESIEQVKQEMKTEDLAMIDFSLPYFNDDNVESNIPDHRESRVFTGVSSVDISNDYGNIIVKEVGSSTVSLEILYYDNQTNKRATANAKTSGGYLTITTTRPKGRNGHIPTIDYILSVPRNTSLKVNLKYGTCKVQDNFSGTLTADIAYGDLSGIKFMNNNTTVKVQYSGVKLQEVQTIFLSGGYSDVKIDKAKTINLSGNYCDWSFGDVHDIYLSGKSLSYGSLKIKSLGNLKGKFFYTDLVIDNLVSGIDASIDYGGIRIKSVSPKVNIIKVMGSYSDIKMSIPTTLSAKLNARISYGDMKIAKTYRTNFTESSETNTRTIRRGTIGNGTPTAIIEVSNNYADIVIN